MVCAAGLGEVTEGPDRQQTTGIGVWSQHCRNQILTTAHTLKEQAREADSRDCKAGCGDLLQQQ